MPVQELLNKSAPVVLLILIVLGGIYGGFFTPTEAGGVGALGAFIVALTRKRFTLQELRYILLETGRVTAAITILLIAAHMYSRFLALTGLPNMIGGMIADYELGLLAVLLLYLLIVLLLGAILDASSIMLILLPLVLPVMKTFDVNLVWFGILTIIAVEVGLLTPPLGVACFVIKSNLNDPRIRLNDIFIGAAPFALAMVLMILLVLWQPGLTLWLL